MLWDPYEFIRRFRRSLLEMDELLSREVGLFTANFRIPRARIREEKGQYIYEIELPGVEKKDIEIEVGDGLQIKAERHVKVKGRRKAKEEHILYNTVLPVFEDGDYGKAKATFKDGVLVIKVPKAKRRKRIKVK